ncbi:WD domain, G-beta repeat [Novymonas esmeraldas]|uniref:WD domain, G-beta repeat n=1 Tax=Novymonas esmeraldas TaxID=1808958 RepID=A0AAW0F7Z1_9TRYP
MPPKAHTYEVATTVEALNASFSFGPDCHIDRVLPDASRELVKQVDWAASRVSAVDGRPVADSPELKAVLLAAVMRYHNPPLAAKEAAVSQPPSALFPDTAIVVTFERTDEHASKVAIEGSVVSNGAVSKVEAPTSAAVQELLSEIAPPSSADPPPVMASIDAELRGSFRRSMIGHPGASMAAFRRESAGSAAPHTGAAASRRTTLSITPAGAAPTPAQRRLSSLPRSPRQRRSHSKSSSSSSDLDDSEAASEASSSDFDTVRICQLKGTPSSEPPPSVATPAATTTAAAATTTAAAVAALAAAAAQAGAESPTPGLLEFEKMKLSMRGDEMLRHLPPGVGGAHGGGAPSDVAEMTVKGRLRRALDRVEAGYCVICVTQDVNPIAEIELLALAAKRRVVAFDLSVKLRLRPKPEALAAQFAEAMRSGAWFVMVNAHKSISTCLVFEALLQDAHEHNLEGFDPSARIIIGLESHPHFPQGLVHHSVVIKLVSNFQGSSFLSDSMAASISRARLVTADALTQSQIGGRPGRASLTSAVATATVQKPGKKQVRISAAVDIVDIAPREIVKAPKRDCPIDVSGSVALFKTFSGVSGDKFLCVRSAGEEGRFAVGSSCGNVYFLDSLGNSLLQAHAHNASIWDVSFNDKFHFATGCEDGTSAAWKLGASLGGGSTDDAVLVPTAATSLGSDVYCVCYLKNMNPSPLLIGGLHNSLVIREAGSDAVHLVPIPSNAQVVDCLPNSATALVGGGDGSVCVVDVTTTKPLGTLVDHTRKLPALAVRDDNQFFTGSFDSSILSWDLRVPGGVTSSVQGGAATATSELAAHTMHTLKLKNYVTGLDVDDVHLAASVGENLYLWDVRKLHTVLGGYPQGWKGLSRGVKVQSMAHLVVTASPDGFVRFWSFV